MKTTIRAIGPWEPLGTLEIRPYLDLPGYTIYLVRHAPSNSYAVAAWVKKAGQWQAAIPNRGRGLGGATTYYANGWSEKSLRYVLTFGVRSTAYRRLHVEIDDNPDANREE